MYERAITLVKKYIHDNKQSWKDFSKRSYSIWAATEIITRLMDQPLRDPEMVVLDFLLDTIICLRIAQEKETNSKNTLIFSTAMLVAEDILILFQEGDF